VTTTLTGATRAEGSGVARAARTARLRDRAARLARAFLTGKLPGARAAATTRLILAAAALTGTALALQVGIADVRRAARLGRGTTRLTRVALACEPAAATAIAARLVLTPARRLTTALLLDQPVVASIAVLAAGLGLSPARVPANAVLALEVRQTRNIAAAARFAVVTAV